MLKNISDDIACLLVKKRIVSNEKREMYSYGMEVILLNSLNLLIALFISLFSSTISHFVVFVLQGWMEWSNEDHSSGDQANHGYALV